MKFPLPKGWVWVRCHDVIDVRDGTHDTPQKVESGIPMVTSKNLKPYGIDFDDVTYISEEDYEAIEKRSAVDDGDILFAMIGTIGNPVLVKKDRPFSIKNVALFKIDETKVHAPFFKFMLDSPVITRQLDANSRGGNQKFVSLSSLRNMQLPLPPLPEQKRIAAILDKADSIRRKRQEAVRLTEELLRSVFLDMFGDPVKNPKGWETLRMEEIILDGPQNGLYRHESDYGSGTQIVRIDSFYDGEVTGIDSLKRVRLDTITIQKYQLQEDDLLVNRVNSRKFLGKSAIVPNLGEPTVFESNMMRITVNKKIVCPHYLVSLLQQQYIKTQIDNKAKDAVNQSSINQDDVKSFELRIPPLELQSKFKGIKRKIYGLFLRQNTAVGVENALFNSLLQRAFMGEL